MKNRRTAWSGLNTIGITVFFLGCFMALILFGTNIYRAVNASHIANNDRRSVLSYLLTVSRSDETGMRVQTLPEGQMLVIADGDTGFGTRIYLHDGSLVEDYGRLDGQLYPDAAAVIGETDVFEIVPMKEDLLRITTASGTVYIHVRNPEGGGE